MSREITFCSITDKDNFIKKCTDTFKVLKEHYNFYFGNICNEINNLDKLLSKKRDTFCHRVCVYYIKNECYFVIYRKYGIDINILTPCVGCRIAHNLVRELEKLNIEKEEIIEPW